MYCEVMTALVRTNTPFVLILNDKVKTTKQYVKIFADAGVEEPRMARPENFEIVSRGFLNKEGKEADSYHFNASYFYWRTGGDLIAVSCRQHIRSIGSFFLS